MGLASVAASVALPALPTSLIGKGTPFEAMMVTLLSGPDGFLMFSSVVRQMPEKLLDCSRCPPPPIPSSPTSPSLQRLTDETDVTDPGANDLPGWEPVASA